MADNSVEYTNNTTKTLYPYGQHFWSGMLLSTPRSIPPSSTSQGKQRATAAGALKFATVYVDNLEDLPTTRKFITAFDIPLPREYGPYGSESPKNYELILGQDETIKEVIVRHGFIVDAIGFVVANKSGETYKKIFGGDGGDETKISLKSNEHINQISGTYGKYQKSSSDNVVATLWIHTNLNPAGYGPFGRGELVPNPRNFISPIGPVVGFFGNHNNYLNSVGIYLSATAFSKEYGPYGSQSPKNYDMILGQEETIKEVIVRHGFIVDAIGFVVADKTGATFTKIFGGDRGVETKILLKSNEHINQISGTYGKYQHSSSDNVIATLLIHTNLNPAGYGPFGRAELVPNPRNFVSPIGPVIGFFGNHNNYLNSLGIYLSSSAASKGYGPYGSESPPNYAIILGQDESIKELIVRHGFIVDAIGFVVADKTGATFKKIFGGEGGTETKIQLKSNEHITQISGTYGKYQHSDSDYDVATLTIHTNLNPDGYGPFGRGELVKNPRKFTSGNGLVVGFFGRQGNYLESVGIYLSTGAAAASKVYAEIGPIGPTDWNVVELKLDLGGKVNATVNENGDGTVVYSET